MAELCASGGFHPIELPLTGFSEGSITVYLVETSEGPLLVDCGWSDDASWAALTAGLEAVNVDVSKIWGVLVTHAHPDHFGQAARLKEVSGAWIGTSRVEAELVDQLDPQNSIDAYVEYQQNALRRLGLHSEEVAYQVDFVRALAPFWPALKVDRRFDPGDIVAMREGMPLRVAALPGHTRGHIGLSDELSNSILTGDTVLNDEVSNVGEFDFELTDMPLLDEALDTLEWLARTRRGWRILPSHGGEITDIVVKCKDAIQFHLRRQRDVEATVARGWSDIPGVTVRDVVGRITWRIPWEGMAPGDRMLALAETAAHLHSLVRRDRIELGTEDGVLQFSPLETPWAERSSSIV